MKIAAIEELLLLVEDDVGISGNCANEPDNEPVGTFGDGTPLPMTFGHVRRARQELDALKS